MSSQVEDKGDKHEGKANQADEDEEETNMASYMLSELSVLYSCENLYHRNHCNQ